MPADGASESEDVKAPEPNGSDSENANGLAAVGPLVGRMAQRIATMELSRFWKIRNAFFALRKRLGLSPVGAMPPFALDPTERSLIAAGGPYAQWLAQHAPRESDLARMREVAAVLPLRPTISLVMAAHEPVMAAREPPIEYLRAALDSVLAQAYPHWELCVADPGSKHPEIAAALESYAARDGRIRLARRSENGCPLHETTYSLETATGEFVAFLEGGDQLAPDACFEMALCVNRQPDADMIYSDEDGIDEAGVLRDPSFKPAWSPDSFLSRMYTGRLAVYRRSLVNELGGARAEFGRSLEYDLVLRLSERTERIHHVPRVLYHRRVRTPVTALAAGAEQPRPSPAARAIAEALERRGEPGAVHEVAGTPGVYIVRYRIAEKKKVSIVIPTRDRGDDVNRCLSSLFAATTYPDFEVLLVDNATTEARSVEILAGWARREPRVRLLRYDVPFNYAKINNWAAAQARGSYLVLLNNDTEILTADWLEAMVEQAQRPSIGAVGAMLLYGDDTVQHGGMILGINGFAGHGHRHFPRHAPGYCQMLKAINNYSAVTAACLMARKELYDRLGGLEEELAIAFNDVDFCLKLGAAGLHVVWLPHVVLRHAEAASRGHDTTFGRRQILYREEAFMRRRWGAGVRLDPYYNPNLTRRSEDFAIGLEGDSSLKRGPDRAGAGRPPTARIAE
jgi:GT2 family glycosyltransferase